MNGPAAVLWDMDGTIVDTEEYFAESSRAILEEGGGRWTPEIALALHGATLPHMAQTLIAAGAVASVDAIVERFLVDVTASLTAEVPWKPGAAEILRELRLLGVPTALVTMSYRVLAEKVIAAMEFNPFDVVVTAEDVEHGKPAPDAYLLAARRLGVDIGDCIAVEDSAPGITAAVSAGAAVVGVPLAGHLLDREDFIRWEGLGGRTAGEIFEAHAALS
ncbi:HAD family hydrolase [Gordonia sp. NPDC003376]